MRSVVEIGASVPAFLGKLWKLVNDSETNHLISWSPGGKTFVIKNQPDFARELLPLYYKHNNMASFIRQLNMYGFHKITSVENGGLRYEKDEIEFSHPCFMRGHAYLLEHIKRKIANPKSIVTSGESGEKILLKPELMNKVLADVKQMKGKQESLDAKFSAMKQENEALWREVAILRQKHIKQQQIVNNLIQFLMSVVQPPRPPPPNGNNVGVKRPFQLMINSAAHNSGTDRLYPGKFKNIKLDKDDAPEDLTEENLEDGPTIHELAHDDILHTDASQDSINPVNFATVDMSTSPDNVATGQNLVDPSAFIQYHVTMEDGEDAETADGNRVTYPICRSNGIKLFQSMPIVTSPSPTLTTPTSPLGQPLIEQVAPNVAAASPGTSKTSQEKTRSNGSKSTVTTGKNLLSSSNFNTINPSADMKLPAEIFASDDSVSDAGVATTEDNVQNILQDPILDTDSLVSTTKDKMFGGVNIKVEKIPGGSKSSKKTKKLNKDAVNNLNLADIKTELQDDLDWNNMTLATVNNNTDVNKFHTMDRRDYICKNLEEFSSLFGTNANKSDIDDHLDSMQTDLDSLRELLRGDSYALDTNTLLGTADASSGSPMSFVIPCRQTPNDYLFGPDDPLCGLSYNPVDERAKASNSAKKQRGEISNVSGDDNRVQDLCAEDDPKEMSFYRIQNTGNILDFDYMDTSVLDNDNSQEVCASPAPSSTLNTPKPQLQLRSPVYPPRRP